MAGIGDTLFWIEAGLAACITLVGLICVVIMIGEFILDCLAELLVRIWHMGVVTEVCNEADLENQSSNEYLLDSSDEELVALIREWQEFTPALIHIRNLPTYKV